MDFTWEREWRIRIDQLAINQTTAFVVVPSKEFLDALRSEHDRDQDYLQEMYALIFNEITAWQLRADFNWRVYSLAGDGSTL